MTAITHKRLSNILRLFFGLAIIYIITFSCVACESKSGQLNSIPREKVVIIDSFKSVKAEVSGTNMIYKYKVKRINHGVVTIIYDYNLYEAGDTIYHKFPINQ